MNRKLKIYVLVMLAGLLLYPVASCVKSFKMGDQTLSDKLLINDILLTGTVFEGRAVSIIRYGGLKEPLFVFRIDLAANQMTPSDIEKAPFLKRVKDRSTEDRIIKNANNYDQSLIFELDKSIFLNGIEKESGSWMEIICSKNYAVVFMNMK